MKDKKKPESHEFSEIPGFDQAIKKIVSTPRATIEKREAEFKKRRRKRKN